MTDINTIYSQYRRGSQGFYIAVETHCGYEISRKEIARIAAQAETAEQFHEAWENDDSWTDENNAS